MVVHLTVCSHVTVLPLVRCVIRPVEHAVSLAAEMDHQQGTNGEDQDAELVSVTNPYAITKPNC